MHYTGRTLRLDANGNLLFEGSSGKQYASESDMAWIDKVQNDPNDNESIEGLWTYLSKGDAWHRQRFSEAWFHYSNQDSIAWGGTQGAFGGAVGAYVTLFTGPLGGAITGYVSKKAGYESVSQGANITAGGQTLATGVFGVGVATGAFTTTVAAGVAGSQTPLGRQIIQEGQEAIAKLPVPGNLDLGRQLWGTNPEFARNMLQQITRGSLEGMGVTREWLVEWIRFYENEAVRAASQQIVNPSVQPRLELLKKALELFGG